MKSWLMLHGLLVYNLWLSIRVETLDSGDTGPSVASVEGLADSYGGYLSTEHFRSSIGVTSGTRASSIEPKATLVSQVAVDSMFVRASEQSLVHDSAIERTPNLPTVSVFTGTFDSMTETKAGIDSMIETAAMFDSMTGTAAMFDSMTETEARLNSLKENAAMLKKLDSAIESQVRFDSSIETSAMFDSVTETSAMFVSITKTATVLDSATETAETPESFVLSVTPTKVISAYSEGNVLSESTAMSTSCASMNLTTDRMQESSNVTVRSMTSTNRTTHVSNPLTNTSSPGTACNNTGNATLDVDQPPQWLVVVGDRPLLVHIMEGPEINYTLAYQVEACGRHCRNGSSVRSLPPRNLPFSCSACHCDKLCMSYGDCCPDENGTVPTRDSDVTYVCIRPGRLNNTMYYMIKSCPPNVTSVVSDELYPVTSARTLQTYFNQAFAACNNDTDVIHWLNETHCSESDSNETTTRETTQGRDISECHVSFTPAPGSVTHRQCSWHKTVDEDKIVDKCNNSGKLEYFDPALDSLCQSSEYLVDSYDTIYKNAFCSLCNTILISRPSFDNELRDDIVSLGVLTGFIVRETKKVTCAENEWSDPVTKRCREITCVAGRHFEAGHCVFDDTDILHTEYINVMKFTFSKNMSGLKNWTDVMAMVRDSIPEMLSKLDVLIYSFRVEELVYPESDPGVETDYAVGVYVEFISQRNDSRSEYESYLLNITWGDWIFHYNDAVTVVQPERYDYSADTENLHIFTFDPLAKTCCSDESYITWLIRLSELFSWFPWYPEIIVPLHSPFCPYITFYDGEFTVSSNGSLMLFSGNATLRKEEYFQEHLEIHVCLDTLRSALNGDGDTEEYAVKDNTSRIQGYLSLVCTCISLICLLLTLITFFKFSALRSLPNKNTMFLSMSLFAAQGTFQFGAGRTGNKMACQIIGAAIHFLWLAVVFWMNVCCYHMFRVFASSAKGRIAHSTHWKILMKYAFYVYGSASAIVSATIGANYAISNGTSIGYGDRLCYISDPKVNGLAFVLPLGITIVVNTVLFSYSIYTISKISKIEETSSLDRRNMFVYIKLSTLTGVFWGLAILAEVTAIGALSYISIVLNGCQGAFIFMSYVANRRVYRMWRKVCRHADYTRSRSSEYTESSRF